MWPQYYRKGWAVVWNIFSAWGIAWSLDMPVNTVHNILHNILFYYSYKISHVYELLSADLWARHTFVLKFLAHMEVVNELPWNILWRNKAHFYLQGFINTKNWRIWLMKNPFAHAQIPVHSAKVIVWCRLRALFIVQTLFFEEISLENSIMFHQWQIIWKYFEEPDCSSASEVCMSIVQASESW